MHLIQIIRDDIINVAADAIVNAANNSLLGGSGVDGAIHNAGGKRILQECINIRNKQGGCRTGEAVITTAGNLPAKAVIHAVGPVWNSKKPEECILLLRNAYINSLRIALEHGFKSIAFPCISTGRFGFPKEKAANVAFNSINEFLLNNKITIEVIIVCKDKENYEIYSSLVYLNGKL